ncbi:MAG: hypothetical protein CSA52_00830 [Gammaproteobacteria bacterium]|nr:MAG: hypothetical protein CSB48_08225 [Pseudomonadota bacterium]PIE38882.1 MAG: hypothetical protein CSA52_00830 [Gammaproteobacteria bacterium]
MGLTRYRNFRHQKAFRLIPSKYPPIDLYEDVASPDQLEAVFYVESLTNPRLSEEVGDFSRVPVKDRLVGIPHCSYVMAAFTHINPDGSRFTSGDFGAYYCAPDINTGIKETIYHIERIFGYTDEPAQDIHMRSLVTFFSAALVDITDKDAVASSLYHATSYTDSQAFGIKVKNEREDGIVYESVRHPGHECFALFRPNLVTEVCQGEHYCYKWNGSSIHNVMKMIMA